MRDFKILIKTQFHGDLRAIIFIIILNILTELEIANDECILIKKRNNVFKGFCVNHSSLRFSASNCFFII